jgi:2-polyprenyl-3-methyl-5-hydroxy-6-metoxy-1,4-benzoquinol methylase
LNNSQVGLLSQQGEQEFEKLRPIMDACGTALAPRDFHWAVNLSFHSAESEHYEREHAAMIANLPQKWGRLLSPLHARPATSIQWLDVGCGPGVMGRVVTEILPGKVGQATFLDPNAEMLRLCEAKSNLWPFRSRFIQGTISDVSPGEEFDLITCNSVLHHVVELNGFCRGVEALLAVGGHFAHCYDPRREALEDRVLRRRRVVAQYAHNWRAIRHWMGETYRRVAHSPSPSDLIEAETNRQLLASGAIRIPLDIRKVWAVTDFHVHDQPGNFGKGISETELRSYLAPLRRQEYFSYCFFDQGNVTMPFKQIEQLLFRRRDPHGVLFGASWAKL